jgi:hypothetical protein
MEVEVDESGSRADELDEVSSDLLMGSGVGGSSVEVERREEKCKWLLDV